MQMLKRAKEKLYDGACFVAVLLFLVLLWVIYQPAGYKDNDFLNSM